MRPDTPAHDRAISAKPPRNVSAWSVPLLKPLIDALHLRRIRAHHMTWILEPQG